MRLICRSFKVVFFFIPFCFCIALKSYAQSYGLGFSSYESVQDKRTSLDLSSSKTLCFNGNFEMDFDLAFFPKSHYFGYIFRIIENDLRNIDLVYNTSAEKKYPFDVVVGEARTGISFSIDANKLYDQWNKLQIKFDFDTDRIILHSGKNIYIKKGLHLKKNACYKIFFGVNSCDAFRSTDTPPMKIRNIRLFDDGRIRYQWPLNEASGTIAHEIITQNNGVIVNPKWVAAMHHEWQAVKSFKINGTASVAFDSNAGKLYLIATDSLYTYSVKNLAWDKNAYSNGEIILNRGNQAIYDRFSNSLYSFYTDKMFVSKYDPVTKSWDKNFKSDRITSYWQVNKFISAADSSLYILNGYGRLNYKKQVQQANLVTRSWAFDSVKGDFYMPRYLAALGTNPNADTAYILGGYGSKSGQQILNPKNTYDMMRFAVKDKAFKKLFDLAVKGEEFTFANSLVIDDKTKTYYGLVFPQHKYNSSLRLLCGSLNNPSYNLIGDSIPYIFHDIRSFADLYYCAESKKFIAVTLLRDGKQTQVNVYSLLSPPYNPVTQAGVTSNAGILPYIVGTCIVLFGAVMSISFSRKRKKAVVSLKIIPTQIVEEEKADMIPSMVENAPNPKPKDSIPIKPTTNPTAFDNKIEYKNTILLFGDLQVFDAEGIEVTKHFSPLIKELFLIILLHSVRWGRGLSSEKLNEILWHDKSVKNASNNRSVNIAKLKNLLDRLTGCSLSKDTGYWKIDIDNTNIYVDYYNYLSIVKDKKDLSHQKIKNLSAITLRGNFLSNIEYEWLDAFKSEISNEVIDTFLHFAHLEKTAHEPEFLIELANYIFYFDQVNEEAMTLKCNALVSLGKHSLAKQAFENFSRDYKAIYGEEFKRGFQNILE